MDIVNQIAANYVESLNQELENFGEQQYCYGLGEIIEFSDCFYFDFQILKGKGSNEDPPLLAGAPGFIIDKQTKEPKVITHGKLAELDKLNRKKEEVLEILNNVKKGNKPLLEFKRRFELTSSELLELKNELQKEEVSQKYVDKFALKLIGK